MSFNFSIDKRTNIRLFISIKYHPYCYDTSEKCIDSPLLSSSLSCCVQVNLDQELDQSVAVNTRNKMRLIGEIDYVLFDNKDEIGQELV